MCTTNDVRKPFAYPFQSHYEQVQCEQATQLNSLQSTFSQILGNIQHYGHCIDDQNVRRRIVRRWMVKEIDRIIMCLLNTYPHTHTDFLFVLFPFKHHHPYGIFIQRIK